MADPKSTQNPSTCHSLQPLTALPTPDPVLFLDRNAPCMDLVDTANHRLSAALQLLNVTASCHLQEADENALEAVSQAAYVLLADGYDLFQVVASRRVRER